MGRSSPAPSSVPGREGGAFHSAWGSIHLRPHEGLASGSKSVYTEGGRALPRAARPTSGSWASVGCPSETCCLSVSFKVANITSRSSQPGERTARDCSRARGPPEASQQQVRSHTQPHHGWLPRRRAGQAEGSECCWPPMASGVFRCGVTISTANTWWPGVTPPQRPGPARVTGEQGL